MALRRSKPEDSCNAASPSISELDARNSSSPHDTVCSRLSLFSAGATAAPIPEAPTSLRRTQPPPAAAASPHDPPKLLPGRQTFGTMNTLAAAFLDHPGQMPSLVLAAGEEENPSYLPLRVPQSQRRRLPVSPLPPAPYRHRLPQQPANCSATTRPPVG
nr:SH3 domain-binding protein 1-like [Vicugna pacos]